MAHRVLEFVGGYACSGLVFSGKAKGDCDFFCAKNANPQKSGEAPGECLAPSRGNSNLSTACTDRGQHSGLPAAWDPIWLFFSGHTLFTGTKKEKQGNTEFVRFFFNNMSNKMGFIRVIHANDRQIMAIRANTAKYGSLTETKKNTGCQVDPKCVLIHGFRSHAKKKCVSSLRKETSRLITWTPRAPFFCLCTPFLWVKSKQKEGFFGLQAQLDLGWILDP